MTCKSVAGYSAVKPLFVPFPLQPLCTSDPPSPQKKTTTTTTKTKQTTTTKKQSKQKCYDTCILTDTKKGKHFTNYLDRVGFNWLCTIDPHDSWKVPKLSTIISIFPRLLETAVNERIFLEKKKKKKKQIVAHIFFFLILTNQLTFPTLRDAWNVFFFPE